MRLTDCDARTFGDSTGRKGLGLMLKCPLCVVSGRAVVERAWIPVHFANPIDGGPPIDTRWTDSKGNVHEAHHWQRTGDTIETLSLSPSLDASIHDHGGHPGWHGYVKSGAIVGGIPEGLRFPQRPTTKEGAPGASPAQGVPMPPEEDAKAAAAVTTPAAESPKTARSGPKVAQGRRVAYVLPHGHKKGDVRAADVTIVRADGSVNLTLLLDGESDAQYGYSSRAESVKQDDDKKPGTWHWPALV